MMLFLGSLRNAALILVLVLGAGGLHAEERQLADADLRKLKPVLQAEAALLAASQAVSKRIEEAWSGFSGDPLELLRSRTGVDVLEGAKYEPRCSRAASAAGPVAIFTFGPEHRLLSPCLARLGADDEARTGGNAAGAGDPTGLRQ